MSPVPNPFAPDPQLVALVTGIVSGLVAMVVAHFGFKKKQVEKEPEVEAQITHAVGALLSHYQDALAKTKDRYEDEIQDLVERLDRQEKRISQLISAMKTAGIEIPPER